MKNKKIKTIDIVFENCEVYSLTPKMIDMCVVNNVTRNIGVNVFQYEDGEVYESVSCKEMLLSINRKGLTTIGGWDDKTLLEDRIENKDITHLDIIYEDGSNDYISVPWMDKDGNEYINALQNNLYYQHKFGNDGESLAIIINDTPLTFKELEEKYGTR